MRCGKCGCVLDDDAVFCYKCGEFVMREEKTEQLAPERVGKRRRGSASHGKLIARLATWFFIAASGVAAAVLGYNFIAAQWGWTNETNIVHIQEWEMALPSPSVFGAF